MHSAKAISRVGGKRLILGMALLGTVLAAPVWSANFSGDAAFEHTRRIVALGPRPSGSPAHSRMVAYLKRQLQTLGCNVTEDPFTARPPSGPIAMRNLIAHFPGSSGFSIVITGHYDTKRMPGRTFVGANDGGSSAGFLLELARAVSKQRRKHDLYIVWFDGEEAIGEWSDRDGLHGSRHLATRWSAEGKLSKIIALINVDMIGDKALDIIQEVNSDASLRRLIWQVSRDLGYAQHFLEVGGAIEDDHMPFVRLGVPAVDLIDFDYGPDNSYWHTEKDTMDKLSPRSFQILGDVLLETIRRLEK